MKIVIICCSKKNGNNLVHKGKSINFVANKQYAPPNSNTALYVHPDDLIADEGITWRALVEKQNSNLLPAYQLYDQSIYQKLYQKFKNDLFIFSAGWGIIRADYQVPKYNITFSNASNVPQYAQRNSKCDRAYKSFNHLTTINSNETILLMGGSDYIRMFFAEAIQLKNKKKIIYTSDRLNGLANNTIFNENTNLEFYRYATNTRTNWHYEFAELLIDQYDNIKNTDWDKNNDILSRLKITSI